MAGIDAMTQKILIYGNGAMARVLYSYARHSLDIAGFIVDDDCIATGETRFQGLPLAPFSQVVRVFDPASHAIIVAVGYREMNALRLRKQQEARERGYRLASYVHESVLRHDGVVIEENCVILDHVSIHPGSRVGAGSFISSNVNIGHDCDIGAGNWINAGVVIAGGCRVGAACFFGVNAAVGDGVTLGERTFVGANTLINKATGDDEVYISEAGQRFPMGSAAFLKFAGVE